jgi:hypothetical protein
MSQLCAVSGVVRDRNGVIAGAVISISRAWVAQARNSTYETQTVSDSSGVFSFSVPYASVIKFASNDVSEINGQQITVPSSPSKNLGVYVADAASSVGSKDLSGAGSIPAAASAYVTAREYGNEGGRKTVLTLAALPVTLIKNGTSTGGGGTKVYSFPAGLIIPRGGSSNLTVANALDKSFLASIGSAAAGTDGTLTSTEISFLPSTAATTSAGVGTCKMLGTSTTPTPGNHLDGTATSIDMYLNSCLNANATGAEALTYSGTITILWANGGDS